MMYNLVTSSSSWLPPSASNPTETPEEVKRCLEELKGLELNTTQKQSINCMLDPACRPVSYIVVQSEAS